MNFQPWRGLYKHSSWVNDERQLEQDMKNVAHSDIEKFLSWYRPTTHKFPQTFLYVKTQKPCPTSSPWKQSRNSEKTNYVAHFFQDRRSTFCLLSQMLMCILQLWPLEHSRMGSHSFLSVTLTFCLLSLELNCTLKMGEFHGI